jgi:hypothetical protein
MNFGHQFARFPVSGFVRAGFLPAVAPVASERIPAQRIVKKRIEDAPDHSFAILDFEHRRDEQVHDFFFRSQSRSSTANASRIHSPSIELRMICTSTPSSAGSGPYGASSIRGFAMTRFLSIGCCLHKQSLTGPGWESIVLKYQRFPLTIPLVLWYY